MKMITVKILPLIIVLLLAACDENNEFIIPEPDDLIVIDGWIENGQHAKVLLTKNSPYFAPLDSASFRELVLTRAKVTLSDGENTEILILRKDTDYFPPYIYEGNLIKGETGKTYTVTAEYGGKIATGSTTIPSCVPLDTIYFTLQENSDSLATIFAEFTDPATSADYYRILTRVRGKDTRFTSSMVMGISDSFFSGQKFGFSILRGQRSYISSNESSYFSPGDTVDIKFCTIDKAHYEFWNTFQDEVLNSGNPFASSMSSVRSNIEGDGLGVWGGYGVSLYTFIIK